MPRKLRFQPEGALVEVTCRTVQGRFLLRPTAVARDLILGIIGRAQRLYPAEVVAMTFLSSHYHMLLVPADAQQLARFVGYVNSNVARKSGGLVGWREKFWGRRYQAIVASDEEAAQVERLRYLLESSPAYSRIPTPTSRRSGTRAGAVAPPLWITHGARLKEPGIEIEPYGPSCPVHGGRVHSRPRLPQSEAKQAERSAVLRRSAADYFEERRHGFPYPRVPQSRWRSWGCSKCSAVERAWIADTEKAAPTHDLAPSPANRMALLRQHLLGSISSAATSLAARL